MCVYPESLSICVCASFLSGFEGRMWDLIVLVHDHCLSFYFVMSLNINDIAKTNYETKLAT